MNTQQRGMLVQQKCFLKCIEEGYIISKPLFDNARYDFILDTGNKLLKIQVKSSTPKDDGVAFIFNGYSQHSTGDGNKRMKYTNKEIDYFMTEYDDVFYLYPAQEEGFVSKTIRLNYPLNGNKANINLAKDFIFQEVIKNL